MMPIAATKALAEFRAKNVKSNAGRPASSVQDPGPRLKHLVQEHGIASIMTAMKDVDYLAKTFSTYDGMLIIGLANSLAGSGEERERMLNRMFGKVPDKQINLNLNIEVTPDQLNDRADALLDRLGDDAELIGD